jgi:hypothetical protein
VQAVGCFPQHSRIHVKRGYRLAKRAIQETDNLALFVQVAAGEYAAAINRINRAFTGGAQFGFALGSDE